METQYIILVRPPGSLTWTLNLKPAPIWSDRRLANNLANKIAAERRWCAVVREVKLPGPGPDDDLYVEIADGEGRVDRFFRNEPWIPPAERETPA